MAPAAPPWQALGVTDDVPDGTAADSIVTGGQDLLEGLGAAVPRLIDRTVRQARFTAALVERFTCAGSNADAESAPPDEPFDELAPLRTIAADSTAGVPASGPPPAVIDLAIHGYDELAASQVVPRLDGLEPPELEAVRNYEVSNRGRRTILGRIAQLQG